MSETILKLNNISYRYPRTSSYVLKNISLEVEKGEMVVVMGENGAGKTTLCKCMTGIIPKSEGGKLEGEVLINKLNTKNYPLSKISQNVGIVLEDPETQLFTTKIKNEIAFGVENLQKPVEKIKEMVNWTLDVVNLKGYEDRHPKALSGGQKQRVAIATVLAMEPDVLILDEPTSQLDPIGTHDVFKVVKTLKEEYNITIVMVSHKSEKIAEFADRIIVMNEGEILKDGTPEEIFSDDEVVEKAWLLRPEVLQLAIYLKEHYGVNFDSLPITKEEGIKKLRSLMNRKGGRD